MWFRGEATAYAPNPHEERDEQRRRRVLETGMPVVLRSPKSARARPRVADARHASSAEVGLYEEHGDAMRKLNKEHREKQQEHVDAIRAGHSVLETTINAFNATMEQEWKKVATALEAYNDRIEDANTFLSGLAEKAQEWNDTRTEKWHEGENSDTHQKWIDEALGEIETVELDAPNEVEVPDDEASDSGFAVFKASFRPAAPWAHTSPR
jgi:hypothetical protein